MMKRSKKSKLVTLGYAGLAAALGGLGWYGVSTAVLTPERQVAGGSGLVSLFLLSVDRAVAVGETLDVRLVASGQRSVAAIQAAVVYDPTVLRLMRIVDAIPPVWLESGFRVDVDGVNNPWNDGDAIYSGLAPLRRPVALPVDVVTLRFKALSPAASTSVRVVERLGEHGRSAVYDGTVPNLDVLGMVGATSVTVTASSGGMCDSDGDGDVDLRDFAAFQNAFTGPG